MEIKCENNVGMNACIYRLVQPYQMYSFLKIIKPIYVYIYRHIWCVYLVVVWRFFFVRLISEKCNSQRFHLQMCDEYISTSILILFSSNPALILLWCSSNLLHMRLPFHLSSLYVCSQSGFISSIRFHLQNITRIYGVKPK